MSSNSEKRCSKKCCVYRLSLGTLWTRVVYYLIVLSYCISKYMHSYLLSCCLHYNVIKYKQSLLNKDILESTEEPNSDVSFSNTDSDGKNVWLNPHLTYLIDPKIINNLSAIFPPFQIPLDSAFKSTPPQWNLIQAFCCVFTKYIKWNSEYTQH
jgi:hypothetical protein